MRTAEADGASSSTIAATSAWAAAAREGLQENGMVARGVVRVSAVQVHGGVGLVGGCVGAWWWWWWLVVVVSRGVAWCGLV